MSMIFLTDNDIVLKLAQFDLLDEAVDALDTKLADIFVTSTARFKFKVVKEQEKGVRRWGATTHARICEFLNSVKIIDWQSSDEELLLLQSVPGIDAGEAVLFSATAKTTEFWLVTGDKRSLRAIASAPSCVKIAKRISRRVLCLEQIILLIIERKGFDYVKNKIVPALALEVDSAIRAAFGSGMEATKPNAVASLNGYIEELKQLGLVGN